MLTHGSNAPVLTLSLSQPTASLSSRVPAKNLYTFLLLSCATEATPVTVQYHFVNTDGTAFRGCGLSLCPSLRLLGASVWAGRTNSRSP